MVAVSDAELDRHLAAAEAYLDRVDDEEESTVASDEHLDLHDGMHVEDADAPYEDGDDEDGHEFAEAVELLDALAEAFNARDVEAIEDLCRNDCETPGLARDLGSMSGSLADLWNRRPTVTLTRAVVDGQALGVVWERADGHGWVAIGTLHVDLDEDGLASVLEFSDDPSLLDELDAEPPDGDLDEGIRWEEWEEGAE